MPSERRRGLTMAWSTALLWGFLAIALKVALGAIDVLTIVWFRFALAFGLLALLIGLRDRRRLRILVRPPLLGLVAAAGLTVNYVTYMKGVDLSSPSTAQVLIQIAPLMLAGVGVACFHERISRRQMVGVAFALGGFALFYRDQALQFLAEADRYQEATLWILAAAFSWVLYAALQKLLTRRGSAPQDLNLIFYALPAMVLLPFADFGALGAAPSWLWVLLVFLGVNTLLAYGALGEALQRLPAHEVSLIITLNPLITLAAMAVLGTLAVDWIEPDRVSVYGYVGAALVVGGVVQVLRRAR